VFGPSTYRVYGKRDSTVHVRFESLESALRFEFRGSGTPWWRAALTPKEQRDHTLAFRRSRHEDVKTMPVVNFKLSPENLRALRECARICEVPVGELLLDAGLTRAAEAQESAQKLRGPGLDRLDAEARAGSVFGAPYRVHVPNWE